MKKMILGSALMLLTVILFAQPQHDGPPKPPPVAERWTHDSTRLQLYVVLSSSQIGNVKAVFISFYNSMDALMQNAAGSPPAREEVEKINKAKDEALQQIFTPEQKMKYHTFRRELMPPPPHEAKHKAPPINS